MQPGHAMPRAPALPRGPGRSAWSCRAASTRAFRGRGVTCPSNVAAQFLLPPTGAGPGHRGQILQRPGPFEDGRSGFLRTSGVVPEAQILALPCPGATALTANYLRTTTIGRDPSGGWGSHPLSVFRHRQTSLHDYCFSPTCVWLVDNGPQPQAGDDEQSPVPAPRPRSLLIQSAN